MRGFQKTWASLVLLMIVLANGLYLPLLQTVAWLNMAWQNEDVSFVVAVGDAINGQDLCGICEIVAYQQEVFEEENRSDWEMVSSLVLALLSNTGPDLNPPGVWQKFAIADESSDSLYLGLTSPPPRTA